MDVATMTDLIVIAVLALALLQSAWRSVLLLVCAVLLTSSADAQTPTNELKAQELAQRLHDECGKWGFPGAIATCVQEKEKAFGKELDQVYKKALTLAGTNKRLLRENQRNWLKYQESTCKFRGQLMKPEVGYCLLEMTLERLEELRGIVGCLSGKC